MIKKAIVLTSGGLDSATCLAIAKSKGFECYALTFDYGQKHRSELSAAAKVSAKLGAKSHKVFHLPIGEFGGSALTDCELTVPDYNASTDIPITYVPARNTIFLSIALAYAETIQAYDIYIGVSAIDYSHYPDCRPEFVEQFQKLADLALKDGVLGKKFTIHTPLINLSKAETIREGLELGVDYSSTISCYRADDDGIACGVCDSCTLRKRGFEKLKISDPTKYSQ